MQETLKTQSFMTKGAIVKALDYITGQWLLAKISEEAEIGDYTVVLNWIHGRAIKKTDLVIKQKMRTLPVSRWPIQPLVNPNRNAGSSSEQPPRSRMRSGCDQYSDTTLGYQKWNCCQTDPVSSPIF